MRLLGDLALLASALRIGEIDDVPTPVGTLHATAVRSSEAHAVIKRIDTQAALALPGVHHVITGEDIKALSDPFLIALKAPIDQWTLAVDRVRYVGEAVALVIADDRYIAEDACQLIDVEYEPLEAVSDMREAMSEAAPKVHDTLAGNVVFEFDLLVGTTHRGSNRVFRFAD